MDSLTGQRTFVGSKGRGRGRGRGNFNEEFNTHGPLWVHAGIRERGSRDDKPGERKANGTNQEKVKSIVDSKRKKENNIPMGREQNAVAVNNRIDVMNKQRELAAKLADTFEESTSPDIELYDEEILRSTFSGYKDTVKGEEPAFSTQHLIDLLQDGATTCIICYETVRHEDPIWSCLQCYCIFHIQCIQKWCKEGLAVKNLYQEDEKKKQRIWCCPKCRRDYDQSECPERYKCFCGKEDNPSFDPWCVPHSCGQQCRKPLEPDCGHECLLLCHPGPCPPCPKMVTAKCFCGNAKPMVKRCSAKEWSCGGICGHLLTCGHHKCGIYCHPGDCPPCPKTSEQYCQCKKQKQKRQCAEPFWQCQQACGKILPCGNHVCEKVCHSGVCGDCPRSGVRSCPCGKTSIAMPCTEDTPTCEDTCDKLLACNRHYCIRKCHFGPCETCRHVLLKSCRCGKREKEVACCTEYTCDFKCTKMRSCGRHGCKRKCCDGSCPRCEQVCNRTLSCRNHKCPGECHQGPCYPCPLKKEVKCFCGKTVLTVACGKEKTIRTPKCPQRCRIPSACHHPERELHRCHYGPCPNCRQTCGLPLPNCQHTCNESCHDHIPAESKKARFRKPWEKQEEEVFIPMPCPPCKTPVTRMCLGKHESVTIACNEDKPFSCKRQCGRLLSCCNHTCSRECHVVKDAEDDEKAGKNCKKCGEFCMKPRPEGCIHDCKLHCHSGPCPDCEVLIRKECYCGLIMLYVKCSELTGVNETVNLLSCKSQCAKTLPCGHQCPLVCHPGSCVDPSFCDQKTKMYCPCKRKKKDFPCTKVRSGEFLLVCDEKCEELKSKHEKHDNLKEEARKEAELKKEQEELEQLERKRQGRRRRPRKQAEDKKQMSFYEANKWVLIGSMLFCFLGILITTFLFYGSQ